MRDSTPEFGRFDAGGGFDILESCKLVEEEVQMKFEFLLCKKSDSYNFLALVKITQLIARRHRARQRGPVLSVYPVRQGTENPPFDIDPEGTCE